MSTGQNQLRSDGLVVLALGNIKEKVVERPKALGDIRGVTYIYGMFYRFGLIDVPDEVKEKIHYLMKQNVLRKSDHSER